MREVCAAMTPFEHGGAYLQLTHERPRPGHPALEAAPVTRAFMDARVQRIYAGTNEIMKVIVAKQLGL